MAFNSFGEDIFTVGKNDEELLSAGDVKLSVFIKSAVVACFEPTVFTEGCLGIYKGYI